MRTTASTGAKAIFFLTTATGMLALLVISLCLVGCDAGEEKPGAGTTGTLGTPPAKGTPEVSVGSLTEEQVGKTISVKGKIVKQCPAVGCWFIVKDDTGVVYVNLNPAGLRLTRDRVGERAKVAGRVVREGGLIKLEAHYVDFAAEQKQTDKE